MAARLLDGKALAASILDRLAAESASLSAKGTAPTLAVLWTGEDASAASYRKGLASGCRKAGVTLLERPLPAASTEEAVLKSLSGLNDAPEVSGILVQTPLSPGVDASRVVAALDPRKDAEGLGPTSLGLALKGDLDRAPCTARAAVALAQASGLDFRGAEAVVVGASDAVGKPAAMLLAGLRATVTLCRSTTKDLAFHTRRAEVLVVAVGKPGRVSGDMIRPGAVVVDVGINLLEGKLVGDVDAASALARAGWVTPVPGGVGPVTSAMLLDRVVASARSALARA